MKRGCLVVGFVSAFFIFLTFGALFYVLFRYEEPGLSGDAFVEVAVGGPLPDYNSVDSWLSEGPMSMRDLLDVLELVRTEPDVRGVVLRITPMGTGWGKAEEIRSAIESLRDSGKMVVAYVEGGADREYYVATAADHIVLPPMGGIDIDGIAMNLQFYGGTFDKIGVAYDGVAIGKYKSAPEHYTRRDMSEAYTEETEALVDGLYNLYIAAIARSRKLSFDETVALVDRGPYDAVAAKRNGLVDDVLYWDEFEAWVEDQGRDGKATMVSAARLRDRAERHRTGLLSRNKIAIVYVQGSIMSGESDTGWRGSTAGDRTVARALQQIREDSRIRGVVIRVDSPGGSVLAADNMWREIELTRQEMPVIISMGDVAASGGYYIAAAGDAIVAEPQTITGSIGIFTGKFVLRGALDKVGVTVDGAQRGEHSDMYSQTRRFSSEEREQITSELNELYDVFVRKVAEGRQMEVSQARELAQGRVWLGSDALRHGLVDQLGGLQAATELAKERAQLAGVPVGLEVFPRKRQTLEDLLGTRSWLRGEVDAAVPPALQKAVRTPSFAYESGEPLALMPFEVEAD